MPLTAPGQAKMVSGFKPTAEQEDVIQAFGQGGTVVVEALAGTGKTTTLKAISGVQPMRPGTYLAFNKAIVREAEGSFPGRVNVTTAHALAYKAIGHEYGHRLPGNPGATRMSAKRMSSFMKVKAAQLDTGTLNPVVVTRMAQATVAAFIKSPDPSIQIWHIPPRVTAHHDHYEIARIVLPVANRIWDDLRSKQGKFFFTHDVYLKLWALSNPVINSDYIMFDEAQDSDPVIASIVARQAAQVVYVGDRNQAIYGWRGAVDSMSKVENALRLPLTKSFRFGPAIAEAANEWLDLLGSDLRVVGHDPVKSTVGDLGDNAPRAILCRTNGTALGWVLAFHQRGIKVALAPGDKSAGKDIERFAWAARDLMNGEGTDHPDLVGFTTWAEVVTYAEEEEDGADLKRMVGIINRIGYPAVIDAIKGLSLEKDAQITVSTAHKAKGLEWSVVKVADDFTPPVDEDEEVDPADLMLAYVTVTRAKQHLDPGSLGEPKLWRP
jgi:superfamily I DNA/RNA helicase